MVLTCTNRRLKIANKKKNSTRDPVTTIKPTVSDKKLRREAKKLAIKTAKKEAKHQKRNQMSVEDNEEDYEDVEQE